MKTTYILLLCILGAALFSTAVCNSSTGPDDCCFKYYPRRIRKDLIKSYYMTDYRCPRAAAIFVTGDKGRHICVDPSLSWVEGVMKSLDEKSF
ncbi:C-C motif chemokine 36.1 [Odontesthes bonariensis]|uniref:C-C motif chemokine 4 homolog n=1 Tax=Odontesthes bonariensis TaxID=219752 RepID=UPI003F587BE2